MNLNNPISPETFEQAERYLLHQMNATEKQQFEITLAKDSGLQEAVQQVQLLILGIKEAVLTEKLDGFHQELKSHAKPVVTINQGNGLKRWLVAASIVILFSVGGWLLYQSTHKEEKIYAAYFQPDPGLITAMSSSDNYVFVRAMVDYKTGNYQAAIIAWKDLLKKDPDSDTLNYFIGSALMAQDKTSEAFPFLEKTIQSKKPDFIKEAYWYAGLVLLKEKKLTEAAVYIRQSDDSRKEKLLEELKQLSP